MNKLQKELQDLKAKVADLEARVAAEPVAKWQPKGGYWFVGGDGSVSNTSSVSTYRRFGTERKIKKQAERAAVEMRRFNRLLALRDELCGDDVVDWSSECNKYFLIFSHRDNKWGTGFDCLCEVNTIYFPTKELVKKACDMLNSGEVEL